jgi:predicted nucleic acid-binding protein
LIVVIDTNVILDALLDRGAHAEPALAIMNLVEHDRLEGKLAGTTITTIHYLVQKTTTPKTTIKVIRDLLKLFQVVGIGHDLLQSALVRGFKDFEDGVIHEAAISCKAEVIITRNIKDFKKSDIPVLTPKEFLANYFPIPE